jgi:hypothetical protein
MTTLLSDSIAIGLAPVSVRSTATTGVQHRWVEHLEVIAEAIMRFSPRERHRQRRLRLWRLTDLSKVARSA